MRRGKLHELLLHLLEQGVFLLEPLGRFNGLADPLAGVEDAVIQHLGDDTVPHLEEQAG